MAGEIRIFEVSPRDGLQAEAVSLDVAARVRIIEGLIEAGLTDIEVGSFVREDLVPQLARTEEVVASLRSRPKLAGKARLWAFVPNDKGMDKAIDAGVDGVGLFVAASETFCRKNVNRTQKELLDAMEPLLKRARRAKMKARVYVSTIVHCPYEGTVEPKSVAKLVDTLVEMGANSISLGDTTGHGTPLSVRKVLEKVLKKHSPARFALHLHDTRGTALANVLEGMQHGIKVFDSSAGGTGGCPYAPGAAGNLATEDLLYMLQGMGTSRSVSLEKVASVSRFISKELGKGLPSKTFQALVAQGVV